MSPTASRSGTRHDIDRHAVAAPPARSAAAPHVDAGNGRSVEFAASGGTNLEQDAQPAPSLSNGREGHAFVAVGPGVPGSLLLAERAGLMGTNPLPVQGAKIHRPLLRDDVLSRERLNGWLDKAVTGRLALIVAEAGFGKTTLLADWARHSSRLTVWYRLEPDDRDWLTFIRHLVASGRELDPDFAPETFALLLQLGPGGPTPAELAASVVREFADFGEGTHDGLTLIFDDHHVIDGSEDTDPIVRALLERTGPRFSVIIATRSTPRLPLGRLRARRGISRLDGDALCFDVPEAARLFRDAYHHPLEPDVVTDLIDRTEGWAALLSLVHTNLEESKATDPRSLIRQLSDARGSVYEYVAQEVIDTLPADLRDFLTHASLLTQVAAGPATLVYNADTERIGRLIEQGEQLGLLTRPDQVAPHRFHPLVKEFLQARLGAMVGVDGVRAMHQELGEELEKVDWRASASHYRAAGNTDSSSRVIDESLERIIAGGQFDEVREFLDGSAGPTDRPVALILRARLAFARGNLGEAIELATSAAETAADGEYSGIAFLNLATILGVSGFADTAVSYASEALARSLTDAQRQVAKATVLMWEAGHEGDLAAIADELRGLAGKQDDDGHVRYASITRLNLAAVLMWLGEPDESLSTAVEAELGLVRTGSPDIERGAALAAQATALAYLGRLPEALGLLARAATTPSSLAREEAALELAKIACDLGELTQAEVALDRVGPTAIEAGFAGLWALTSGLLALRRDDLDRAREMAGKLQESPCKDVAGRLRAQVFTTRLAIAAGAPESPDEARELGRLADAQHSGPGRAIARILQAVAASGTNLGPVVVQIGAADLAVLSMLAEELCRSLDQLTTEALDRVGEAAVSRPERWRSALRLALQGSSPTRTTAAALLGRVGASEDLALLRSMGTVDKSIRPSAVALARALAPEVLINDLGSVEVRIGGEPPARPLRRKVLGLLCFLTTKPGLAATRDEILEALWPDLGSATAANSLHQTIYFLRRVFEPDFREGYSAGYLLFDGEIVSLDGELVDSTSRRCWRLLAEGRRTAGNVLQELVSSYSGRFALDFAYEEWATDYRETLHAAVLSAIEGALAESLSNRAFDRAIELAHAALRIEPTADSVELALLRAYKASGRSAAAAEQYAHYSTIMRDQLGVEPPRWDDL